MVEPTRMPPETSPETPPGTLRPNIDLAVFRTEVALLAETEPEAFLKGLMLECRELVRGSAAIVSDPKYFRYLEDYFRVLQISAQTCSQLTDAIVRLRGGGQMEERRQRIIVERIERRGMAAEGEGGAARPENE